VNEPRRFPDLAHGLRASRKLELFEDVMDVMLHGGDAETELAADLLVRKTLANERKHFAFPARKRRIQISRRRSGLLVMEEGP
jgi:hypothetical protein